MGQDGIRPPDQGEIRAALAGYRRIHAGRDELVRLARDSGIPINEISRLSGLSRTTIYDILGRDETAT